MQHGSSFWPYRVGLPLLPIFGYPHYPTFQVKWLINDTWAIIILHCQTLWRIKRNGRDCSLLVPIFLLYRYWLHKTERHTSTACNITNYSSSLREGGRKGKPSVVGAPHTRTGPTGRYYMLKHADIVHKTRVELRFWLVKLYFTECLRTVICILHMNLRHTKSFNPLEYMYFIWNICTIFMYSTRLPGIFLWV